MKRSLTGWFQSVFSWFTSPFYTDGRLSTRVVIAFAVINGLVLLNALIHDPRIGYDTPAYLQYIEVLSEGRFPDSSETDEYYSPPLAFVPPAVAYALLGPWQEAGLLEVPGENRLANFLFYRFTYSIDDFSMGISAKFAQLLNVLYSIILTTLLLKICEVLQPKSETLKFLALFLLGTIPVYYKSFAFVRAEPLLAMLCVAALYWMLMIYRAPDVRMRTLVGGGLLAGAILLTRQWGFAILPPLLFAILLAGWKNRWQPGKTLFRLLFVLGLSAAMAASFYGSLARAEGSVFAFARTFEGTEIIRSYPADFFLNPQLDQLFRDPVVNSLGSHALPIFYSETWGDYGAYFVVYGRNRVDSRYVLGVYLDSRIATPEEVASGTFRFITNRHEINGFLGRVNLVSLIPSAVLLCGLALGIYSALRAIGNRFNDDEQNYTALLSLFVGGSLAGYLVFLVLFTGDDPTTVKSTYMLQIFPYLALLGAGMLARLKGANPAAYRVVVVLIAMVALHNLPVFVTRQIVWPYSPFGS